MQAAARFEPSRGVRFSTYVLVDPLGVQDYILRNWSIVRTGTTAAQKALFFTLLPARVTRIPAPVEPEGRGSSRPSWPCRWPMETMKSTRRQRPVAERAARRGRRRQLADFADTRPTPEEVDGPARLRDALAG
jgi:RNA polymerase sigma-32 factor